MAGDNYSFKKRQRELAQKKKKEEKLKNKLAKKNLQAGIVTDQPLGTDAVPAAPDGQVTEEQK